MTAQVTVLLHAMFKEAAGKGEIAQAIGSSNFTVGDLLGMLARRYGKDFQTILDPKTGMVSADTLVMLNGQSIRKSDIQLKDKDVIMISIPIGGG